MTNLDKLIRKNIQELKPYSSARDEFQGEASVFLDANENPFNAPYNRYPDPLQRELKTKIAALKNVAAENIFLGNGSDEPIDLVIRAFCDPGTDNVVAIDPTYGMYQVSADINNVAYRKVPLTTNFELIAANILNACDIHTKIVFLCSPNNPTANYLDINEVIHIIENFAGIVVLDEAYIDFSRHKGLLPQLHAYPNLVVLHTFSKAWGMASVRLGMAFASKQVIAILNKIKYPYNINLLTQEYALKALSDVAVKNDWVQYINSNRTLLEEQLEQIHCVEKIFPSDANFLLVKVTDAKMIYNYLVDNKIIVRNRSSVTLCNNCLRITVGTQNENDKLLVALRKY